MKTAALFVVAALFGAAVDARPASFGQNGFRGGSGGRNPFQNGGFGNKGGKASGSAAIKASASASGKASASASGKASLSASASLTASASAVSASASAPPNNNAATSTGGDLQSQLVLDQSVVCPFNDDGQNPPVAGQSPSLTSSNNFINYCATTLPQVPLTNGLQITTGSCNPAPIGSIPTSDLMPSAKFVNPPNNAVIAANTAFSAQLRIVNLQTGSFTNAQKTYFAAPQQLNPQGVIIGHTHIVVESLTSLQQTDPTDPQKFFFFKGVNDAAVGGISTAALTAGVPPGAYRMCSINTSSNHVPIIGPIAQHGSFDDCTYFTAK